MRLNSSRILILAFTLLSAIALLLHLKRLSNIHRLPASSGHKAEPYVYQPSVKGLRATSLVETNLNHNSWTLEALRDLYFSEVLRTHVRCSNVVRVGRKDDGGWDVCMEGQFKLNPGCLAYSFGVGNIWEYDEQLASRYKCTVRAFDPTIRKPDHVHSPGPVHFYAIGIGGSSNATSHSFKTQTLLSLLKKFGEANKEIDVLKIDVEYSEWESLLSIINDGLLKQVKQIYLEYHTNEVNQRRSEVEHYRLYLQIMQQLERADFRKFLATENKGAIPVFQGGISQYEKASNKHKSRSCCYEVYYLNMGYDAKRDKPPHE